MGADKAVDPLPEVERRMEAVLPSLRQLLGDAGDVAAQGVRPFAQVRPAAEAQAKKEPGLAVVDEAPQFDDHVGEVLADGAPYDVGAHAEVLVDDEVRQGADASPCAARIASFRASSRISGRSPPVVTTSTGSPSRSSSL